MARACGGGGGGVGCLLLLMCIFKNTTSHENALVYLHSEYRPNILIPHAIIKCPGGEKAKIQPNEKSRFGWQVDIV
jgi:hypothetical protein